MLAPGEGSVEDDPKVLCRGDWLKVEGAEFDLWMREGSLPGDGEDFALVRMKGLSVLETPLVDWAESPLQATRGCLQIWASGPNCKVVSSLAFEWTGIGNGCS